MCLVLHGGEQLAPTAAGSAWGAIGMRPGRGGTRTEPVPLAGGCSQGRGRSRTRPGASAAPPASPEAPGRGRLPAARLRLRRARWWRQRRCGSREPVPSHAALSPRPSRPRSPPPLLLRGLAGVPGAAGDAGGGAAGLCVSAPPMWVSR